MKPVSSQKKLLFIVSFFIALLFIGSFIFSALEDVNYLDSFYFTLATATTTGYGDIVPCTDGGKIYLIFFMLAGISTFFAGLAVLAKII